MQEEFYRSYDSFALLADVRNGTGLGGCDTGDGFVPISKPKGLPKGRRSGSFGDHSFSWLTLKEMKEYDWNRVTKHRGYVSEKQYLELRESGNPPSCYSGAVMGGTLIKLTDKEYDELEKTNKLPKNKTIEVQMEWEVPYKEAGWVYSRLIPELDRIAKEYSVTDDHVRFVFGFDS